MEQGEKTVAQWRSQIDILDTELLRLLNERARIASELGALKVSSGLPVYDGRRERQILTRLCDSNPGPLDRESITSIFRCIIRESRRLEISRQNASSKSQFKRSSFKQSLFKQSSEEYGHGH